MNSVTACRHTHTQLIAKDSDAEYVECLDCGEILEAAEYLKPAERNEPDAEPPESLSDA